jgi:hypothetical protein
MENRMLAGTRPSGQENTATGAKKSVDQISVEPPARGVERVVKAEQQPAQPAPIRKIRSASVQDEPERRRTELLKEGVSRLERGRAPAGTDKEQRTPLEWAKAPVGTGKEEGARLERINAAVRRDGSPIIHPRLRKSEVPKADREQAKIPGTTQAIKVILGPAPPTVQVTIGRVEIRGMHPPPPPKSLTAAPRKLKLSLENYLQQRAGNPK